MVLSLVSSSVVASEVLFTRILSVSTWYGLAFVVLSLAMLGLTRGSLLADEARARGEALEPWLADTLVKMALALLVADGVLVSVPLTFQPDLATVAAMLLVAVALAAPLVLGGAAAARLLGEAPGALSALYAVDLCAAALGALLPLALLGPLTGPGAVAWLAAAVATAGCLLHPSRRSRGMVVALGAVAVVALSFTSAGLAVHFPKGRPSAARETTFEAWNAMAQVRLGPFVTHPLGGPEGSAGVTVTSALALIDGEAGTPVFQYRDVSELAFLRRNPTTAAHALRPRGNACVIGVGGGPDLLAALHYGHELVLGAEINPSMVELLQSVTDRSPVLSDPRVAVQVGDGRAVFAAARVHCTVLQAAMVDTWAATAAGAFAHTETTLYTREAWAVFLRRVAPEGVLTFSRWYDARNPSETARLLSLAVASLLDRGVTRPREHIALLALGAVATILVSPSPLTPQDLERLQGLETRHGFGLLVAPDRAPRDPILARVLAARSLRALDAAGDGTFMDTSAPTDDRPFFFQVLRPSAWLEPRRLLRWMESGTGMLAGNVAAMFELIVTFGAVLALGAGLLGPSLWRSLRGPERALPTASAGVYFGALGAGFMAAEVALMQRMHVVLGHPTYALVIVLAGLLVATGAGSALSPRLLQSPRAVSVAALLASLLLALLPRLVIAPLAAATEGGAMGVRVLWTGLCAAAVGLVLGMLFPAGMRHLDRTSATPLALGINGACGVLGSIAAIVTSVWHGIAATFALAAALYVLAAASGPWRWNRPAP